MIKAYLYSINLEHWKWQWDLTSIKSVLEIRCSGYFENIAKFIGKLWTYLMWLKQRASYRNFGLITS